MASTGLLGVALAAAACDHVTLFGFGNDSDAGTAATCAHYWECSRNQSRYFGGKAGYHDWHAQWRVLSDWVAEGNLLQSVLLDAPRLTRTAARLNNEILKFPEWLGALGAFGECSQTSSAGKLRRAIAFLFVRHG